MTPSKTSSLSDIDIAVYSLFILGGWQQRIHTEDIALKCFELAPSRFSWVKYQQYPDLMTAWYALGHAKKGARGSLVVGGSERKRERGKDVSIGWRLSDNGIKWIKANQARIESILLGTKTPQSRLSEHRRLKTLISSKAYNEYLVRSEKAIISRADFLESLVCTVNTKPEMVSERIEQLYSAADILNQVKVKEYLDFYRKHFAK